MNDALSSGAGVFPSLGARALSALVHFTGTAALAVCLTRRLSFADLNSLRGWKNLTVARGSLLFVFADSLAFILSTGVLVHGIGLDINETACSLAIFACIALYTSSKIGIYVFLSEKVWIVWSNMGTKNQRVGEGRLKSRAYCVCITFIFFYVAVIILALVFRVAELRKSDGVCVIGLKRAGSLPLLTYDAYITVLLTGLFIWPLWSNNVMSSRLRAIAIRTLIASFVTLATSTANIAILTYMHGHQRGFVCLVSCSADVMINALVLDFVTESRLKRHIRHFRAHNERTTAPTGTISRNGHDIAPKASINLGSAYDSQSNAGEKSSVGRAIQQSNLATPTPHIPTLESTGRGALESRIALPQILFAPRSSTASDDDGFTPYNLGIDNFSASSTPFSSRPSSPNPSQADSPSSSQHPRTVSERQTLACHHHATGSYVAPLPNITSPGASRGGVATDVDIENSAASHSTPQLLTLREALRAIPNAGQIRVSSSADSVLMDSSCLPPCQTVMGPFLGMGIPKRGKFDSPSGHSCPTRRISMPASPDDVELDFFHS